MGGRPPTTSASMYLASVWGGARALHAIRKTPFIFLATRHATRRGITKGHDAAFTAIIRLITRHIIYTARHAGPREIVEH